MNLRLATSGLGLASALLALSATSNAAPYGTAGCGLGSVFFGSNQGSQIFAATTNGSSGNQTFGISSGTSNCVPGSKAEAFNKQRDFVDTNLASLASEMAQGSGETLAAYTQTLGCEVNIGVVNKALQAGHAKIFSETSAQGVVFATNAVLKGSSEAAIACKNLI
jgi:hypothetical protein